MKIQSQKLRKKTFRSSSSLLFPRACSQLLVAIPSNTAAKMFFWNNCAVQRVFKSVPEGCAALVFFLFNATFLISLVLDYLKTFFFLDSEEKVAGMNKNQWQNSSHCPAFDNNPEILKLFKSNSLILFKPSCFGPARKDIWEKKKKKVFIILNIFVLVNIILHVLLITLSISIGCSLLAAAESSSLIEVRLLQLFYIPWSKQ